MAPFTLVDAQFLGAVLQAFAFGIYSVLLGTFFSFEAQKRRTKRIDSYLFYPITLLALLSFTFFGISTFIRYQTVANGTPKTAVFLLFHLNLATSSLYAFIDWISQLILIYRCWVVWNQRWSIIIVPLILSVASFVCTLVVVGGMKRNFGHAYPEWIFPVGTSGFSLSLAVNAIVTTVLVSRIWVVSSQLNRHLPDYKDGDSPIKALIAALIETGMLTFVGQLLWVVLYSMNNSIGFAVISGVVTATYGITPTLLAIRVILQKSYPTSTEQTKSSSVAFASRNHGASTGGTVHDSNGSHTAFIAMSKEVVKGV